MRCYCFYSNRMVLVLEQVVLELSFSFNYAVGGTIYRRNKNTTSSGKGTEIGTCSKNQLLAFYTRFNCCAAQIWIWNLQWWIADSSKFVHQLASSTATKISAKPEKPTSEPRTAFIYNFWRLAWEKISCRSQRCQIRRFFLQKHIYIDIFL